MLNPRLPSVLGVFPVNLIGIAAGIECINTFFLQRLEVQTVLENFWRSQDLTEPPAPSHLPTQIMENSNKTHLVSVLAADFPKFLTLRFLFRCFLVHDKVLQYLKQLP